MQKADAATRPRSPLRPMICTSCPACAAPLPHTNAKQCSRCKTRYCGPECQKQHWEEGGHDKLCRKIRTGGGAEQYYANNKYAEAVAVAVEKCAEDTKGQTCYICTEAVHRHTKEGLVRGCACRGTSGVAHVSCLVEQAKILIAEAEENNLGIKYDARWRRWDTCSLCEQQYHGVVRCALGWACWKTYLGRAEADQARFMAMTELGNGLLAAKQFAAALPVKEAELSMMRRLGASHHNILIAQGNLANTYAGLGRWDESLGVRRDIYCGFVRVLGEEDRETLLEAHNFALSLVNDRVRKFGEAKSLLRKTIPAARRVLGDSSDLTLTMRKIYGQSLYLDDSSTPDDLREAVTTLEDTERIARRVLGGAHPITAGMGNALRNARAALRAREEAAPDDVSSVCGAMAAMMTPGDA